MCIRDSFKADALKAKGRWWLGEQPKLKHEQIAARSTSGPARFWFAVPDGLLALEEVPEWAGLLGAVLRPGHPPPHNVLLVVRKEAPQLHRTKASVQVESHAASVCYYRFHKLFQHPKR